MGKSKNGTFGSFGKLGKRAFAALFLGAVAVVGTGCPPSNTVEIPDGVSQVTEITFLIEVWEGESRITGVVSDGTFEFNVLDAVTGHVRNTYSTTSLTVRNGRSDFTTSIAEGTLNVDLENIRYTTYLDLGERGFAEGWIDAQNVEVSLDGKTLILPVVFDLANPTPDAPTPEEEAMNILPSLRRTREGQYDVRLAHNGVNDRRSGLSGAAGRVGAAAGGVVTSRAI